MKISQEHEEKYNELKKFREIISKEFLGAQIGKYISYNFPESRGYTVRIMWLLCNRGPRNTQPDEEYIKQIFENYNCSPEDLNNLILFLCYDLQNPYSPFHKLCFCSYNDPGEQKRETYEELKKSCKEKGEIEKVFEEELVKIPLKDLFIDKNKGEIKNIKSTLSYLYTQCYIGMIPHYYWRRGKCGKLPEFVYLPEKDLF